MNVHLERHGTGEKVLFVHGAGGSSLSWYSQKQHLQTSMEVLLVDLPGHGQSTGEGCKAVEECRDQIYHTLQRLDIKRFYLVGHSMGGAIAMSFALSYPDLLKGLVLVATGAKLKVFPEILEGILKDKEATVRKITEYAFSKKAAPSLIEDGIREMMKTEKEVVYRDFESCDQFSVMGRLAEIETPTLVICGEHDLLTPPRYSEFLHAEIKGSQLVLIPDAGHMVMLEKPEEVNQAIKAFVNANRF